MCLCKDVTLLISLSADRSGLIFDFIKIELSKRMKLKLFPKEIEIALTMNVCISLT